MIARTALTLACLLVTWPLNANELTPEQARRFVVGKLFSFTCFEGTSGAGRVFNDGSVAGVVRFSGSATGRYVTLPPNTLRVQGDSVCASVRGLAMQPCFTLVQLSQSSFRGSVRGLGFASCNFIHRGGRTEVARASSATRAQHSGGAGEE